MSDVPDPIEAIRSGSPKPPAQPPFLLDPGYAGTLDSDAFRKRFADLVAMPRNIPAYGCYALFFSLIFCVVPLGLFAYNRDLEFLAGCSASAFMVWGLIGYFAWVWSKGWRYERRMRRLAWYGQLVPGTLLVARRTRQTIPGSDFSESEDSYTIVALEVQYQARTPAGLRVQGAGVFRRDDLLNADLPEPGTPVWVLVLDDSTHAVL
jgi:hypothetical protein